MQFVSQELAESSKESSKELAEKAMFYLSVMAKTNIIYRYLANNWEYY
jgi:hypothetical protein